MSKDSKRFQEAKKALEVGRVYTPLEGANLLKSMNTASFDETVEVHIKLGVNPRHADQQVRGTVMLPHGTGKTLRVAVFAKGEKATEAEAAGADLVGAEDLAAKIEGGMLDFDAAIATPDLMPNPKAGTVTFDIGKAVTDMKAGKVEYRTDKFGVVHSIIGKKSFTAEQLAANYAELLGELVRAKPSASKGKYLRTISMSSTMGPGIPMDTSKTGILTEEKS
jgi:large subunit ribosomal protein L1